MLALNLKKKWYDKIASGKKTVEYRNVKPYWTKRICNSLLRPSYAVCTPEELYEEVSKIGYSNERISNYCNKVILRLGYTKEYMTASVVKLEVVDGVNTDLAINKPVYAIYLENIKKGIKK